MAHLNYSTYLKLDDLLKQQIAQSAPAEHDELLFIVIHQTYELWFKLILHEMEKINRNFSDNDLYGAIATFRRVRTVMKTLVGQVDILETMTPMSFTSFRDRLDTSSGFQSYQYRELEFVLGYKRPEVLKYYPPDLPGHEEMQKRLRERTMIDHFYDFLASQGAQLPDEVRNRDVSKANQPHALVQDEILRLYKSRPDLAILFEAMIDFDEGLQEWRYRHVKLVERTIGSKTGTGGSPGVDFLKKSLFLPAFADLWAVRVRM